MSDVPDFSDILQSLRQINSVGTDTFLPLHAPVFLGNERRYVLDSIESTFVSSAGKYVDKFEESLREITGAQHVTACVNGTAALQVALTMAGVEHRDLVITQSLSFVATANAIRHAGADPVFIDVDAETLGMSPQALRGFLESEAEKTQTGARHRESSRKIGACVPMHTFGFPCNIEEILAICEEWGIPVVEDAAEALGSTRSGRHCGTFASFGVLSFNGNKVCTAGGGGAILTNNLDWGNQTKHRTTTAKRTHRWEFYHDQVAWNFRLPNINAALACAQLEQLPAFIAYKRSLAGRYAKLFAGTKWKFLLEPKGTRSNYWLTAVLFDTRRERDAFLEQSNDSGIQTRPVWQPLHTLPMYKRSLCGPLEMTLNVADRLVNLPSGVLSMEMPDDA